MATLCPSSGPRMREATWWLIPLSKWVITPVINGISRVNPLIIGVITHLLSGMSHQVGFKHKQCNVQCEKGPYNVVPPSHREVGAPSQAHSQWHPVQSTHGIPLSSTMPVRENEVSVEYRN